MMNYNRIMERSYEVIEELQWGSPVDDSDILEVCEDLMAVVDSIISRELIDECDVATAHCAAITLTYLQTNVDVLDNEEAEHCLYMAIKVIKKFI